MPSTIISIKKVTSLSSLSRSTVYRRAKEGTFPKPVNLGGKGGRVGWIESEVQDWISARVSKRDD